ncbi:MAG TPA: hypothetical protein VLA02_00855 [Reyranella sp.]|nr:hypothetical protein [Reyranella sp.]
MSLRKFTVLTAIATATIGGAFACGPFFPWQLLDDRSATLLEAPAGLSFVSQIRTLVAPPHGDLKLVEPADDGLDERPYEAIKAEEEEGKSNTWRGLLDRPLSQQVYLARLSDARGAGTAEAALTAGVGLPAAVLEYIAGAVAFNGDDFDTAIVHFQAIDRLPPEQRRPREVWAAYMQARTHYHLGDLPAARTAYQTARARALAGAPDPLGLGLASLGEEARLDLKAAGLLVTDGFIPTDEDYANAGAWVARAVELYAEQAARGSQIARRSLRDVASMLASNDEVLGKAIVEPVVRRLLVAYSIANDSQSEWEDAAVASRAGVPEALIDALLAQPSPVAGDDVDRLAMLAYQTGRYAAAEKLTAATDRSLGLWVRAKLALRRNDRTSAVGDLGAALKAMTADLDEPAQNRLRGELGVVQLSEGKYRESMELLFPLATTYWGDVVYVAERVLTIDELKAFVDALPADSKPVERKHQDEPRFTEKPAATLRQLLARRLVRQGQLEAALPYFAVSNADPSPRALAETYRAAVDAAQPTWRWRNVSRAEALFQLATLTRTQGMELMGTEGPPDYAAMDGNFNFGIGQTGPWGQLRKSYDDRRADTPSPVDGWDRFVDPAEIVRVAASSPKPDSRFHYRAVAADRALEAAALLPQGSQAYAATLCWAARYAFASDDANRAEKIYLHYVATGPYQAWATRFGRVCPQPDFDAARDYWPKRIVRLARRHPGLAIAATLAVVLLLAGAVLVVRRRHSAALQAKLAASSGLPLPE